MSESTKKLVIFHSYRGSFAAWQSAGILERELMLYRKMKPYFKEIIFVAFADNSKAEEALAKNEFRVLANEKYKPAWWYALTAFWQFRREFKRANIFKTNQLSSLLIALPAKLWFWRKALVVRAGFLWSDFQRHSNFLKKIIVRLLEACGFWLANEIIVTSETDKQKIARVYNVAKQKITVIRNSVDLDVFRPSKQGIVKSGLCAVGRLTKQKNYGVIIEALANSPYELHIFGQGELHDKLQELTTKLSTKSVFHGVVPNPELASSLARCQAFVLASFYEGSPKALFEAMAAGLAVIVSDIPHHREIIQDGQNGLLVKNSAVNFRAATQKIMSDAVLRTRLGQAARAWTEQNCSPEKNLQKELKIYDQLIQ